MLRFSLRRSVLLTCAAWLAPLPVLAAGQPAPAGHDALATKCAGQPRGSCHAASRLAATRELPPFAPEAEPAPTETLAEALDAAYRTAPSLQAQRYQLRASDEDYAQALAETRPVTQLQLTGDYSRTIMGELTQAANFAVNDVSVSKSLTATATLSQPLYTGGKATADRAATLGAIAAGREQLRAAEGDVLLQVITAYAYIRRDAQALRLRAANLKQLAATLDEVRERRAAGELTRTDEGLAETQLELAQSLYNSSEQQWQQDRAVYAQLVGHEAGALAPLPGLGAVPASIEAVLAMAEDMNPDLAVAVATEQTSRAQIAAARAAGRPTLALVGNATLTGQALPYYLHNQDQVYEGRAVLTIPVTAGGAVRARIAQQQDRNAADRLGIETAHRQLVANIVSAWSSLATARRNIAVYAKQAAAARIYDEGTFEEYRGGLRSTFDVLYAHETLRDTEIQLVGAEADCYVAQATLLRRMGLLEARHLLTGTALYHPEIAQARAARASALPWDGAVRALDALGSPAPRPLTPAALPAGTTPPAMAAPATDAPRP